MKLEGKITLITGSGGLIGREVTRYCRESGATVIGVDYAINRWGESPDITADITDPSVIEQLFLDVHARYGRIDGLVDAAYPRTKDWGTKCEDVPDCSTVFGQSLNLIIKSISQKKKNTKYRVSI